MRNELHYIQQIEKYLMGILSTEEKMAFETQMKHSTSLTMDVALQQSLIQRIKVNAFMDDVQQFHSVLTGNKISWWKKGFGLNMLLILLVVGAITAGGFYISGMLDEENPTSKQIVQVKPTEVEPIRPIETSVPVVTELKEETVCCKKPVKMDRTSIPVDTVVKVTKVDTVNTPADWSTFTVNFISTTVNADKDVHITMENSGSVIFIPALSMAYKNGMPVHGNVEFKYREFRHPAEMVLAGIPMMYNEKGKEYRFNSCGMFEMRAFKGDQELKIKNNRPITVHYNMTQKIDSTYFFALNDKTQQWEKLEDISNRSVEERVSDTIAMAVNNIDITSEIDGVPVRANNNRPHLFRRNRNREGDALEIENGTWFTKDTTPNTNKKVVNNMAQWSQAGHTFPNMVAGLQCRNFGVHNCDAIGRIRERVTISASFVDETGAAIKKQSVLVLIDKKINSSFSFGPTLFFCGKHDSNVLLLFTSDKKLYVMDEESFKNIGIQKSGDYTFTMKNRTNDIKCSSDLKNFLGLK